jgi:hypothetical protein
MNVRRAGSCRARMGGTGAVLAAGVTEDELGLTALREVATRELAEPRPFWWTYRARLAIG